MTKGRMRKEINHLINELNKTNAVLDGVLIFLGMEVEEFVVVNPFGTVDQEENDYPIMELYSSKTRRGGLDKRILKVIVEAIKNGKLRIKEKC